VPTSGAIDAAQLSSVRVPLRGRFRRALILTDSGQLLYEFPSLAGAIWRLACFTPGRLEFALASHSVLLRQRCDRRTIHSVLRTPVPARTRGDSAVVFAYRAVNARDLQSYKFSLPGEDAGKGRGTPPRAAPSERLPNAVRCWHSAAAARRLFSLQSVSTAVVSANAPGRPDG
jgi:hypothetical protein